MAQHRQLDKSIHDMSEGMQAFCRDIQASKALQEALYYTKNLSDVAEIAQSRGHQVTAAEIMYAQAGRALDLPENEREIIAEGKRPEHGAQWGREGTGYLEEAGYWLVQLIAWCGINTEADQTLVDFLHRLKNDQNMQETILLAKTHNALSEYASEYGCAIPGTAFICYQASQIQTLKDKQLECLARGYI